MRLAWTLKMAGVNQTHEDEPKARQTQQSRMNFNLGALDLDG